MESYKVKILAGMFIFLSGVMIFPALVFLHPYIVPKLDPWTTPVKITMDPMINVSNMESDNVAIPVSAPPLQMPSPDRGVVVWDEDGFNRPVPKWNANLPISKLCTSNDSAVQCMACALYFEARGETPDIQFLVGKVILNRVKSRDYPNTICKVVWQRKQFSWTHDGFKDVMRSKKTREQVITVARGVMRDDDYGTENDAYDKFPVNACWYHDDSLSSTYWSRKMTLVKKYGPFYVYKGKACRQPKKKVYRSSKSVKPDVGKDYILLKPAVSPRL